MTTTDERSAEQKIVETLAELGALGLAFAIEQVSKRIDSQDQTITMHTRDIARLGGLFKANKKLTDRIAELESKVESLMQKNDKARTWAENLKAEIASLKNGAK